ncbi:MAG TPA: choice-of-anchor tandem repeat GloVer-containing protein [Candidatus Baltobacteraceae bacterium]
MRRNASFRRSPLDSVTTRQSLQAAGAEFPYAKAFHAYGVNKRAVRLVPCVLIGILLAACSGQAMSLPSIAPNASPHRAANARYRIVHTFDGASGGANPEAGLIVSNGTFYGTTFNGGAHAGGVVFAVTPSGQERALYSFAGVEDGFNPYTSLTEVDGTLFGDTTSGGGYPCHFHYYASGCGTIFAVSGTGRERILYRFEGTADGATPQVGLVTLGGTLYGAAQYGGGGKKACGEGGCGTIFSITTSGKERTVFTFSGANGSSPLASMIVVNGLLYGTTFSGGANNKGTIFGLAPSGKQRVVYSFKGGKDGAYPWAPLLAQGGSLYGTTLTGGGGKGCRQNLGCGTIFKIDASGKETVVHRFGDGSDGGNPQTGLTYVNGAFYGVAARGGNTCKVGLGCGTLFKMTPSGTFSVLHRFNGGVSDGSAPQGDLLYWNGLLYGTTLSGGSGGCYGSLGCGTIFSVKP